jgi:hypothetical protein
VNCALSALNPEDGIIMEDCKHLTAAIGGLKTVIHNQAKIWAEIKSRWVPLPPGSMLTKKKRTPT